MKVLNMKLLLIIIYLLNSVLSYETEEDKNYFQLYPSEDKNTPYLFHIYDLNSIFSTVNSTDGENMTIIKNVVKEDEIPIKDLSSVIQYKDQFTVKTCFGPNKIVEVIDDKKEVLVPEDDYFKNKKNLASIKYCYSSSINNPYIVSQQTIVIFWTDFQVENGTEIYTHKSILFFPHNRTFSKIYILNTTGENFYAQSCTNLRNKFIYCNMDQSLELSKKYHFSIILDYLNANQIKVLIRLVTVFARFSNAIYHKPIGIFKYFYANTGKYADYFLTEYHDKENGKTRLVTSVYVNYNLYTFILRFEELGIYQGINIEDVYINPNLFNHLLPNTKEVIIIYIMKGVKSQNLLLLNKYDYTKELKYKTKFDKLSLSNYQREDICKNPKYMQSMFINSFINYDTYDKAFIEKYKDKKYFTYQKDIATFISCDDENGKAFYQAKKIQLPQCLNTLNEINGNINDLVFPDNDDVKIHVDFENPNYKSFRNVSIEFFDSYIYNRYIIVQGVRNGERLIPVNKTITLTNLERLEFSRTMNFRKRKTYRIPYRITQTAFSGNSTTCHLTSDLCYFEFSYAKDIPDIGSDTTEDTEEPNPECPFCEEPFNNRCSKCEDIIGLIIKNNECGCECDEEKGFKKEPNITFNMCECKDGYSFNETIHECSPNIILDNKTHCVYEVDENTGTYIYTEIKPGMYVYKKKEKPGILFCDKGPGDLINRWFYLGNDVYFIWVKIQKCVYIINHDKIVMYSNKEDCEYDESNSDYYTSLLNIKDNETYYVSLNNSYEYKIDDNESSLIIEEENITFYLLNKYTEKNFSSIRISDKCLKKVQKIYNMENILIFMANIKVGNNISHQVEYLFYNSVPEFINDNIPLSLICQKEENDSDSNTTNLRSLSEESIDNENHTLEIDEIEVNVQVNWTEEVLKNINELKEHDIDIFDTDHDFYNNVCFPYTTKDDHDIYLTERKNNYYPRLLLCENVTNQTGYDNNTMRVICKGPIKENTNVAGNVTFIEQEVSERFKNNHTFPDNFRVMLCLFKVKFNIGQVFALILFIAFVILSIPNYCCRCKNAAKNKKSKNKDENKRKIFDWEVPLELLKKELIVEEDETKEEKKEEKKEKDGDDSDDDPDIFNSLRPKLKGKKKRSIKNKHSNEKKNPKEKKEEEKKVPKDIKGQNLIENNDLISENSKSENDKEKKTIDTQPTINIIKKEKDNQLIDEDKQTKQAVPKEEPKEDHKDKSLVDKAININEEEKKKEKEILIDNNNKKDDKKEDKKSDNTSELISEESKQKEKLNYSADSEVNISSEDSIQIKLPSEKNSENDKKSEDKQKKLANPPPKSKSGKQPKSTAPGKQLISIDPEKTQNSAKRLKGKDKNKISDEKKDFPCYQKLIYEFTKDLEKCQCCQCFCDDDGKKKKKSKYRCHEIFAGKLVSENTFLFAFPLYCELDKNTYFIKYSILILYISCLMSFNILTEYRLSDLHLYYHHDKNTTSNFDNFILNAIPPYIVDLIIRIIKKAISLREFYLEEYYRIEYKKNRYKKNLTQLEIKMHEERTRIKKFKNNLNNSISIVTVLGYFLTLFNFYLVLCFCGIFRNSFLCLVVNTLCSVVSIFVISAFVNLIVAIIKYDFKRYLIYVYAFCCSGCYCAVNLCLWKKEELKIVDDDDDEEEDEKKKKKMKKTNNVDDNEEEENKQEIVRNQKTNEADDDE